MFHVEEHTYAALMDEPLAPTTDRGDLLSERHCQTLI